MEVVYNWKIMSLGTSAIEDDLEKVVKHVNWRLIGIVVNLASAEVSGTTNLSFVTQDSFIDWDALTKETVVQWIESIENVDAHKAEIVSKINAMIGPEPENLEPPFGVS